MNDAIDARTQSRKVCVENIILNTLLGRSGTTGGPGTFHLEGYCYNILRVIQAEVSQFRLKGSQSDGPNLFIRTHRNMAVADVTWLVDQNNLVISTGLPELSTSMLT